MLRILRAFAWMRWRVLVNSLERTSARDTLERLSLAIEQLGPLLAAALLIPSAAALAALAAHAGYMLASGADPLTFRILRYVLLGATAFAVVGPVVLPGADRSSAVRVLLLPIPRRVLYVAQSAGGIADPWILLVVPVVLALPLGLAAGGASWGSLVALASGLAFFLTLLGVSSLATLLLQLITRNRRRGELIALLFIVFVPLLAVVPGMIDAQERRAGGEGGNSAARRTLVPPGLQAGATRAFAFLPSELHADATRAVAARERRGAPFPVALLFASAALLHGAALLVFGRLLDSPSEGGARRGQESPVRRMTSLPGLSAGASAVALAQLRLAFRTPRGRSILLSPPVVTAMFGVLMMRGGDLELGFITLRSGLGLAVFGGAVSLMSILPFAMNQFAMDRSGLTLTLLSPLREIDLLTGKLVGNGLIASIPALVCLIGSALLMPGGSPVLWLVLVLGFISTYCLAAPAAAAVSATLPRAVDLNSIGSRSNAHGLAGLLGIAAFALAGVPSVALLLLATRVLDRPSLAPWLALAWCLVSVLLCRALLIPAGALLSGRRENLALVAAR